MSTDNIALPDRAPTAQPVPLHWTRVFGTGLVLWLVSVALLVTTQTITLIPTVILLGSFLIPVTAVIFYVEHDVSPTLRPRMVIDAFLLGGLLGVFGAVALEALLLRPGPAEYVGVGLIEEGAKLLALVVVARGLRGATTRDGIVLGSAVGFGFGALESSGYTFSAMLTQQGLSIPDLVQTEILRGLLSPVGHGLWTGLVGGVLFSAAGATGRLHLTWSVIGAYLAVAALHALWDSMGGLAVIVAFLLTATPAQRLALETGRLAPVLRSTDVQTLLYLLLYWGGLLIISVVGLLGLRRVWRRGGSAMPAAENLPKAAPA